MKLYLIILFFAFTVTINLFAQFSGGSGTSDDPFQITKKEDIESLADSVNNGNYWSKDKYFKLMKNIDDSVNVSIGIMVLDFSIVISKSFQGIFDGNNKYINISIDTAASLFQSINSAEIKNLTIKGKIEVVKEKNGNFNNVSGIINNAVNSSIKNCTNYVNITYQNATGIVSIVGTNCIIEDCVNYGNIYSILPTASEYYHTGGIIGKIVKNDSEVSEYDIQVINCKNYGEIRATNNNVGGIIGYNDNLNLNSMVLHCKNYGEIRTTNDSNGYCGGIIGYSITHQDYITLLTHCENYGNINSANSLPNAGSGGIVGYLGSRKGTVNIIYCINKGTINGIINAGGIVGLCSKIIYNETVLNISNCSNYATIQNIEGFSGGIVGWSNGSLIKYCNNYGIIDGNNEKAFCVGGIVGHNEGYIGYCTNLEHTYNDTEGINGYRAVGGIAGHNAATNSSIIEYCINTGSVRANNTIGGICGYATPGKISSCINSGLIIGDSLIGGIYGCNYHIELPANLRKATDTLTNCINTGVIFIPSGIANYAGGIAGNMAKEGNYKIENCFYDKQMCIYGGINGKDEKEATGRLTKELIGNNLELIFKNDNWVYNKNLYPMLKDFENTYITANLIAASPVYFDDLNIDYDKQNNIRECFYVNTENGIKWRCANNNVTFANDDKVFLNKIGQEFIFAVDGNYEKKIPIIINKLCEKLQATDTIFQTLDLGKIHKCSDITYEYIYSVALGSEGNFVMTTKKIEGTNKNLFSYKAIPETPIELYPTDSLILDITFVPSEEISLGTKTAYFDLDVYNIDMNMTVTTRYKLIAEVVEGIIAEPNPVDFGNILVDQTFKKDIKLKNQTTQQTKIKSYYLLKNTEFKLEIKPNLTIEKLDSMFISIAVFSDKIGNITDTLIVILEYKYCDDTLKIPVKASINTSDNINFTIIASEHKFVTPTNKNYKIPIYLVSDRDINFSLSIKELIFTINRNVFHPERTDNGDISYFYNNNIIEIKTENILLPELKRGDTILLLNIIGDIILGNTDSSYIDLVIADMSHINMPTEIDLIDGYITTKICEEGDNRLLYTLKETPGVFVLENPVNDLLKIKCICYERGSYYIEIVDITGNTLAIKEWNVNPKISNEFFFDIDIPYYIGNGNYYIIMHGPNTEYYNSFIIAK